MKLFAILTNLRLQDILDILFLTLVCYHLYRWFHGTKAFKALVGLLALGMIFSIARLWGLFLTTWFFNIFWQALVFLIIILFQSEIRQVLERFNPLRAVGFRRQEKPEKWVQAFTLGVFALAKNSIGALFVIECTDSVNEYVIGGQNIDGEPGNELLLSIFNKLSPLHDGAVLIQDGRIKKVSCYLPLSSTEKLPKDMGTRHRAGLGLSERCDASVVVVSEESGNVSLCRDGELIPVKFPEELSNFLVETTAAPNQVKTTWQEKLVSFFTYQWSTKFTVFALVFFIWIIFAGQQDFEADLHVPLGFKNVPAALKVVNHSNIYVDITVRGLRKDVSILNERNVQAELNLSAVAEGRINIPVTREDIYLTNDRINIVNIEPPSVIFEFIKK
jgi:uncharacterized protein (TIGR00159 family)